jgi:phosphoribosylaminoimidazolecarboxamide formyltransferase/IMP cyclohydrolase
LKSQKSKVKIKEMFRSLLNGVLIQGTDEGNYSEWKEVGGRETLQQKKKT